MDAFEQLLQRKIWGSELSFQTGHIGSGCSAKGCHPSILHILLLTASGTRNQNIQHLQTAWLQHTPSHTLLPDAQNSRLQLLLFLLCFDLWASDSSRNAPEGDAWRREGVKRQVG